MKKIIPQTCRVIRNKKLDGSGAYYSIRVAGFKAVRAVRPGHFVHIKVADAVDPLFRRAFSVAGYDRGAEELEIIYKIVGRGTSLLGHKVTGDFLDMIGPLGNHFAPVPRSKTIVLVAGGVGFPPLYFWAGHLIDRGHQQGRIVFFYGARSRDDLIELTRIRRLGVECIPCTDDGSYGFHGFVTEALHRRMSDLDPKRTIVCGCGPEPMLAALQKLALENGFSGEVALEAPMPCGVGVCLGCVKPLRNNPHKYVRVCYDGPVFKLGEVAI